MSEVYRKSAVWTIRIIGKQGWGFLQEYPKYLAQDLAWRPAHGKDSTFVKSSDTSSRLERMSAWHYLETEVIRMEF